VLQEYVAMSNAMTLQRDFGNAITLQMKGCNTVSLQTNTSNTMIFQFLALNCNVIGHNTPLSVKLQKTFGAGFPNLLSNLEFWLCFLCSNKELTHVVFHETAFSSVSKHWFA
jgi:hypothetical protein